MAPRTRMMSEAEAIRTINRHLRVGGFSTADIAAVMRDARLVAKGSVFDYTRGGRQWMKEPVAAVARVLNRIYNQKDPTRAFSEVESLRRMKQPRMGLSKLKAPKAMHVYRVSFVDPKTRRPRAFLLMSRTKLKAPTYQRATRFENSVAAQLQQLLKQGEIVNVSEQRMAHAELTGNKMVFIEDYRPLDKKEMPSFRQSYDRACMDYIRYVQRMVRGQTWNPPLQVSYVKKKTKRKAA